MSHQKLSSDLKNENRYCMRDMQQRALNEWIEAISCVDQTSKPHSSVQLTLSKSYESDPPEDSSESEFCEKKEQNKKDENRNPPMNMQTADAMPT